MTVGELIKELSQYRNNLPVHIALEWKPYEDYNELEIVKKDNTLIIQAKEDK